ncbi:MAG: hypothetical protein M0000_07310 [Actinomycetota bacterium]|nr:hypothetical protein [Actinomycetota bacterium]
MNLIDTKQGEIVEFLTAKYKDKITEHHYGDYTSDEYKDLLNRIDHFREGCEAMVEAVGLGRREWEEVARALGI